MITTPHKKPIRINIIPIANFSNYIDPCIHTIIQNF